MKERPILMSGEEVRAILDGRKTMTRRIVKWPLKSANHHGTRRIFTESKANEVREMLGQDSRHPHNRPVSPYGKPGDLRWVKETWVPILALYYEKALAGDRHPGVLESAVAYRADHPTPERLKWKHSVHMPRWASRLTLRITSVRVERLKDISEDDCEAEGYEFIPFGYQPEPDAHGWFRHLWDSINGKGSWNANPWVWVIEFEVQK